MAVSRFKRKGKRLFVAVSRLSPISPPSRLFSSSRFPSFTFRPRPPQHSDYLGEPPHPPPSFPVPSISILIVILNSIIVFSFSSAALYFHNGTRSYYTCPSAPNRISTRIATTLPTPTPDVLQYELPTVSPFAKQHASNPLRRVCS